MVDCRLDLRVRRLRVPATKAGALHVLAATALGMLALVLYVPSLRELFRLARPDAIQVAGCVGAGLAAVAWVQTVKAIDLKGARRTHGRLSAA